MIEILWNVLDFLPAAAAMLGEMGGVEILEGLLRQLLTNGYRKQARLLCLAETSIHPPKPNNRKNAALTKLSECPLWPD